MTKLMPAALAVVAVTAALLQLPGRAAAAQLPASCGDLGIPVVIGSQVYATKYTIVTVGPGPHTPAHAVADPGTTVSALVVGKLEDGQLFWNSSSPPAGTAPHPGWFTFQYTMPVSGLITGFDVGVYGMYGGETRELCIPPQEGYGEHARPGIPANSTLVFTITAEAIVAPASSVAERPARSAGGGASYPYRVDVAGAPLAPGCPTAQIQCAYGTPNDGCPLCQHCHSGECFCNCPTGPGTCSLPPCANASQTWPPLKPGPALQERLARKLGGAPVVAPPPPAPAKYDACAGKSDGDMCTACDPSKPACQGTGVVMTCQAGKCVPALGGLGQQPRVEPRLQG